MSKTVIHNLGCLRAAAAERPIDMKALRRRVATKSGREAHQEQMRSQTVVIPGPFPFSVTFSIETGHRCGSARHMSMSVRRRNRAPSPEAAWIVAEHLGFRGGINECLTDIEDRGDGEKAYSLIQPVPADQHLM